VRLTGYLGSIDPNPWSANCWGSIYANGNPIPIDGLVAPTQSLGGFQLGMSANEAIRKKGQPIHRTEAEWDYNSIDAAHDGVLSIEFERPP
jgi:hypothetical protein